MYCKKCGKEIEKSDMFCANCGTKVEKIEKLNVQKEKNEVINSNTIDKTTEIKSSNGTASLIIGILSIMLALPLSLFIIPIALIGLILGLTEKGKDSKKIVGIILNILAIVIPVTIAISAISFMVRDVKSDRLNIYDDYNIDYDYPDIGADLELDLNSNNSKNDDILEDNVIYNNKMYEMLDSMRAWNMYSNLRKGNLGKVKDINGGWKLLGEYDTYWEFKDGQFWWYKSANDLNDNYWQGTTQITKGKDGFKLIDYDESKIDEIVFRSKGEVTENDIYTIILTPKKVIVDGIDKSSTNIEKGSLWKHVWILVDHGNDGLEGQVQNVNTSETSYYVKVKD